MLSFFHLAITLSVILPFISSDYSCIIFKLFCGIKQTLADLSCDLPWNMIRHFLES